MDTQPQYIENGSDEHGTLPAPDMTGQDRCGQDMSGHVPVDVAMLIFLREGLPRNKRSIRRYCERGDVECTKVDTENGQRYMLNEQSLLNFIVQQKQIYATGGHEGTGTASAGHDRARPTVSLSSQASAPMPPADDTVTFLKEQLKRKDEQIEKKDEQITAMLERDRETNVLIKELQGVVQSAFHLLGSGRERDSAGHGRRAWDGETRSIPVYSEEDHNPNREIH